MTSEGIWKRSSRTACGFSVATNPRSVSRARQTIEGRVSTEEVAGECVGLNESLAVGGRIESEPLKGSNELDLSCVHLSVGVERCTPTSTESLLKYLRVS